jgi:hypothetical protein
MAKVFVQSCVGYMPAQLVHAYLSGYTPPVRLDIVRIDRPVRLKGEGEHNVL